MPRFKRLMHYTLCATFICSTQALAEIYRYVDKQGRIYFTDKPDNPHYKRIIHTWKGWQEAIPASINEDYRAALIKRRARHDAQIARAALTYRLPEALLHAVIVTESAYRSDVTSRAGAVGLMQLMPQTAQRYGVKNRRDPIDNINGGARYLRELLVMFDHDLALALAAYNAGENAVKRYSNQIPPFTETQNYVKKVLHYYKRYQLQDFSRQDRPF